LRRRDWIILAVGAALAAALLAVVGSSVGFLSEEMASWLQAVGSIGAILLVTLPVVVQQRTQRENSREVVLASAELAFALMSAVADRYMDPDRPSSEWWVPQWDIYRTTLETAPIHETGSKDALRAFVHFRELFERAEAFAEPTEGGELVGFVAYTMTNAARSLQDLKDALAS